MTSASPADVEPRGIVEHLAGGGEEVVLDPLDGLTGDLRTPLARRTSVTTCSFQGRQLGLRLETLSWARWMLPWLRL